jgi:hypothetical protein
MLFKKKSPDSERVKELETAIHNALDQSGDNICYLDIYRDLGKLVGREFNPVVLSEEQHMDNCRRYHRCLVSAQPYNRNLDATDVLKQRENQLRAVAWIFLISILTAFSYLNHPTPFTATLGFCVILGVNLIALIFHFFMVVRKT